METIRRPLVTLDLNGRNYPKLILRAQAVRDAMTAAVQQFPAPAPTMAVFAADVQALVTAQAATKGHVGGMTAPRDAKAVIVVADLQSLAHYVQGLVDASPADAATLASAAAMHLRKARVSVKPPLAVTPAVVSGTAKLVANSGQITGSAKGRPVFNWQISADGGTTWSSLPATPHANTEVAGLTVGSRVSFRVSARIGKTVTAWSNAVPFLVH